MSNGSVLDRISLQGKTALVTGAGQGIGRAIAQTLAKAGALVGCLDRNAESLQETVDLIQQAQGMALALVADVSSQAQTQAAVDKLLERSPSLHILINGAAAALLCVGSVIVLRFVTLNWNVRTHSVRPLSQGPSRDSADEERGQPGPAQAD